MISDTLSLTHYLTHTHQMFVGFSPIENQLSLHYQFIYQTITDQEKKQREDVWRMLIKLGLRNCLIFLRLVKH